MEYAELEYVKNPVPRMFFGTCIPSMKAGADVTALLDRAVELGITAFDTARCYGKAEQLLGEWMEKRGIRDKLTVLSKGGINGFMWRSRIKESCIRKDIERSLQFLRTDHIDIYLLHRDDKRVPVGDIMQLLNALKAEGKVHAFGGSNWTHERIESANEYAYAHNLQPMTVSSPNYGLAVMVKDPWGGGLVTLTGDNNASAREWYERTQMPVVAWSSVGNGIFSGRFRSFDHKGAKRSMNLFARVGWLYPENLSRLSRAEKLAEKRGVAPMTIAIAYAAGSRMNVFPVIGAGSVKHLEENVEAFSFRLSEEERAYLEGEQA